MKMCIENEANLIESTECDEYYVCLLIHIEYTINCSFFLLTIPMFTPLVLAEMALMRKLSRTPKMLFKYLRPH